MCELKKGNPCIYTLCRTTGTCILTGNLCSVVHNKAEKHVTDQDDFQGLQSLHDMIFWNSDEETTRGIPIFNEEKGELK